MAAHAVLIAGTHSGVGKTTVALALMAALRRRGLTVQPFKVGPDFIDPGHHTLLCGRTSRNLDTWMLSADAVRATFERGSRGAAVAVVEGVMGLFDGRGPTDLRGSSAAVAQLLDLPVVLVVDAAGQGASAAAVVRGFAEFDPTVRVSGVICNRVAGPQHYEYLEPAIRANTKAMPLGWLPRDAAWEVPERHLGLTTAGDLGDLRRWDHAGAALAQTVDVDLLLDLCKRKAPLPLGERGWGEGYGLVASTESPTDHFGSNNESRPLPPSPLGGEGSKIVAVARDAAFCFYYAENLELLTAAGGVIELFSPLADRALPEGADVLYLGGGYPELHAARLAANTAMRESIRRFHERGGVIYAECGGLMYVCRELVDVQGAAFPMLDLLPARTVMQSRRAALGYVELQTSAPSPLGPAGTCGRGHEFHYSRLEPLGELSYVADLTDSRGARRPDGIVSRNLYAGYAHLHFGANPALAAALLR